MFDRQPALKSLLKSQWTYIILFAVLGLIGVLNHSMWRDEMNVWLIAKYSENLSDFLTNIHYDRGHPGLWHLLVAISFHLVDNPIAMQILHWSIGLSAIILLWLFSPFTQRQKILFSFGYLPFHENLLISRNYGLGMLLLFAICTVFASRNKTYLGLSCLLVLLANSNIYGLLIGFALALTLAIELCCDSNRRKSFFRQSKSKLFALGDILVSAIIIAVGFLVSAYTIFPPVQVATESVLTEISADSNLERFLISLGRMLGGYTLLIPNPDRLLDLAVCGVISLIFFYIFATNFIKKPLVLFFFVFSTLELLIFSYVSFPGRGPRHFGHFYFILIAALWLANNFKNQNISLSKFKFLSQARLKKTQAFAFMLVLYIQFFAGLFGFTSDLIIPYSAGKQVANYLKENNLQDNFIIASRDVNMASISGYLGKELYYAERDDFGSYSLFLRQERKGMNHTKVLEKTAKLFDNNQTNIAISERILLILYKELKESHPDLKITPIEKFERAWKDSERYYLYAIERK